VWFKDRFHMSGESETTFLDIEVNGFYSQSTQFFIYLFSLSLWWLFFCLILMAYQIRLMWHVKEIWILKIVFGKIETKNEKTLACSQASEHIIIRGYIYRIEQR